MTQKEILSAVEQENALSAEREGLEGREKSLQELDSGLANPQIQWVEFKQNL